MLLTVHIQQTNRLINKIEVEEKKSKPLKEMVAKDENF